MTNELSKLQQQIQEALQLLQESKVLASEKVPDVGSVPPPTNIFFAEQSSLLNKCTQVFTQHQPNKPTIRIIHHVACSGGTLISKCLSAMPNVYLLSEVHPYTDLHLGAGKPRFLPSDIASLSKHARIPAIESLLKELFLQNIITSYQHVVSYGGTLVLREHTHSDFHVGGKTRKKPSVVDILSDHFTIKSVLTFRNPIDSYLSLQLNKWVHFQPGTFEEYCSRILQMLSVYENLDIYHYEDFIASPNQILEKICASLDIGYNENWKNYFDIAQVTGDSGRSSPVIEARPRRELTESFNEDIFQSKSYREIKNRFNY